MSLSRKHYVGLANTLKANMPHSPALKAHHEKIINAVSSWAKSDNPKFNEQRFKGYIHGENGSHGGKQKSGQDTAVLGPQGEHSQGRLPQTNSKMPSA